MSTTETNTTEELANAVASYLGTPGDTWLSPETHAWMRSVLDPEGISSAQSLAEVLSEFFKSDAFCIGNFPELNARNIKRLKWTAQNCGFRHLNEVLAVLSVPELLKGDTIDEVETKLRALSMGDFAVREDLASLFAPIVKSLRNSMRKRTIRTNRAVIGTARKGNYVPHTTFIWGPTENDKDVMRMRFKAATYRAPSLLEKVVEEREGLSDQPISFGILNQDPKRNPLPNEVIRRFNAAGIAVFKKGVGVCLIKDSVPLSERYAHMLGLTAGLGNPALEFGQIDWEYINTHKVWTTAALWLFRTFEHSIDSTYLPSIVTTAIEPSTFTKAHVMFAQTTDEYGMPTGMDGGGWLPPYFAGKPTQDQQVRGLFALNEHQVAYVKGMMFTKWDCCSWQARDGSWQPFWTNTGREAAEQACGLSEFDLLAAYWENMKAPHKGYPDFNICGIRFRALPVADINQVKGMAKSTVKAQIAQLPVYPGYIGALRVQGPTSKMGFCFEALQWLQADLSSEEVGDCPVKTAIDFYQRKLVSELKEEGLAGLAQKAALQDEGIDTILQVLEVLNSQRPEGSPQISWQSIPTIRSRINSALEKTLYWGGEGGAIEAPQIVYQLSNQVPKGHVICTRFKPGTEVMTFRFPMSSPSALCVLTVLDPADFPQFHTSIDPDSDGEIPPGRCIMNPADLTSAMQGDDDGDTGGITSCPLIIAACKQKWENRVFSVEVIGTTKLKEPLWSVRPFTPTIVWEDGRETAGVEQAPGMLLAARDRRGAVGLATRMQQWAEAMRFQNGVYNEEAAELCVLMAWLIQAEIDMEKKTTLQLKFSEAWAAGLSNCCTEKDGVWSIHPNFIEGEGSGIDACMQLVKDFMIRSGCMSTYEDRNGITRVSAGNPIGWYSKNKRVDIDSNNWCGAQYWPEGELHIDSTLHWSFRNMERHFNTIRADLDMENTPQETVSLRRLMYEALIVKGHNIVPLTDYNDEAYSRMQRRTKSESVRKELGKAQASVGENAVQDRIQQVLANQQEHLKTLSLQELADAWALECWYFEAYSKLANDTEDSDERKSAGRRSESALNAASRLVAFAESPLAIAIGINTNQCDWVAPRLRHMMDTVWHIDETQQAQNYTRWVETYGHLHATHAGPNGEAVHFLKCTHCTEKAQNSLVRKTREHKHKFAVEFYKGLNTHVNANVS
jgi:hypothetical protein